jgi:curved DNA-binding protein CbpA
MSLSDDFDVSVDYYEVLQVSPSATAEDIQKSFRRLVLVYHPDKNPDRREWSEQRIRELIRANEVLGDEEKRRVFDQVRRLHREPTGTTPREPFYRRRRDPAARARLILHLLLEEKPSEARTILAEEVARHGEEFLSKHLERRDYLDCAFLLAEHALERKDFYEAFLRLRDFYRIDRHARYPRHYRDHAHQLLKDVFLRKLPKSLSPEGVLSVLFDASDLDLSPPEDAQRLELVAEAQIRSGDREGARISLARLEALAPHGRGVDRVRRLLAG